MKGTVIRTNLYCPKCGKQFIIHNKTTRKRDGAKVTYEICKSYGCNYSKTLKVIPAPSVPAGEYNKNKKTGQLSFQF